MKVFLKLYVAGDIPKSMRVISNLKKIAKVFIEGECDLEVVDIIKNPQLAVENQIIATPTLIKSYPAPHRKVIGDLSDTEAVLSGLGLRHRRRESTNHLSGDRS
jgi:circadian clock protein KaiB